MSTPRVVRLSAGGPELTPLMPGGPRAVVGLSGAPGAGKSTLATWLVERHGGVVVPMDGFHYADVELRRRGLVGRKGAPETFDAEGYSALLTRVRTAEPGDGPVMAPAFERDTEQPLAGAIAVPPTGLVVTEGNYLLLDEPRWRSARARLDVVWHVRVADDVRRRWLRERHERFGKSAAEALAWIEAVDEPNAAIIEAASSAADVVLDLDGWWG